MAVGDGSDPHLVSVVTTGPATVDAATAPHTDAGITAGSTFEQLLTATRASTNLKEYCG